MRATRHLTLLAFWLLIVGPLTAVLAASDDKVCEGNEAINSFVSSDSFQGRSWSFGCRYVAGEKTCQESGNVNQLYRSFTYQCPRDHYLAGIKSANYGNDRRWSYYCCKVEGGYPAILSATCSWSSSLNDIGGSINFNTPTDYVIVGVESTYQYRDRQWRLYMCRMQ